jgi:hypothetical protein
MNNIEPNLPALPWFCILLTVSCVAFLVIAGMFPLSSRPEGVRRPGGALLIVWNLLLLLALAAVTAFYGYTELRWSTLVVVGGVILLFSPLLFQIWPAAWRDNRRGMAMLLAVQALALMPLTMI